MSEGCRLCASSVCVAGVMARPICIESKGSWGSLRVADALREMSAWFTCPAQDPRPCDVWLSSRMWGLLSRVERMVEGWLEIVATGSNGTEDCRLPATDAVKSLQSKSTLCVFVAVCLLDLETSTLSPEEPLDRRPGSAPPEGIERDAPAASAFRISCSANKHRIEEPMY